MNPIQSAVEPRRAVFVRGALDTARVRVERAHAALARAGWDLNVAAPYPNGRMRKSEYLLAKGHREFLASLTDPRPVPGPVRPRDPDYRQFSGKRQEEYLARVEAEANAAFDEYVAKLTGKVGEGVVKAEIDAAPLWNGSILTVTRADGSVERWRTKTIVNVSVLGKLFNQWPTRRIG